MINPCQCDPHCDNPECPIRAKKINNISNRLKSIEILIHDLTDIAKKGQGDCLNKIGPRGFVEATELELLLYKFEKLMERMNIWTLTSLD